MEPKTPLQILDSGVPNPTKNSAISPTTAANINPYPTWTGTGLNPNLTQSTTTLSSDKSQDILNANKTLQTLSGRGITTTTDPNGNNISTYSNGDAYDPTTDPKFISADTSSEDASIQKNLDTMKANTDAITASQISSIQNRYKTLKENQKAINESTLAVTTNALLTSGAAKHDVFSEDAIQSRMEDNAQKLNDLDQEESDLINAAKSAQLAGNNRVLEQMNTAIQKKREDKQALAQKINEDLIDANKKSREVQAQAQKDTAIADIYASGTVDVPGILTALKLKGRTDITSKDVTDTLKNIVPSGLDDLVKTLRQNGAPQDVIAKVLASPDINTAYKAAGNYGAGGTGIIGEYNYYRAQAQAAGQTPVDFNAYQNMDANRKIKIAAAANAAGLTASATNTALKLSDDYEARSKEYYQQREAFNRIKSSASDPSAAGDLALIFNYMKVLDPGSTVREGEFANAENAGSAFNAVGAKYNKVVNGERLTDTQRKDFVDRATKLFNGAKAQQDTVVGEFKTRAKQYGVPDNLVVRDTSATGSNATDLVKTEDEAKTQILEYGTKNPTLQESIKKMVIDGVPYLQIKAALAI